jgi:ACS family tartrate transporter-like MFS transporter
MDAIEKRTMDKVTWRLVPFLIACYFIAYLDRVNVGFANASMSKDLGLSAAAFGGAAGIFFIAYFFFEVPSNLALNRFGARLWIARIMFTWGIISGAQAFVVGETSFNVVRLLLGLAEAGFFPGIIFFLTLWFPSAYRARIVGMFMFAIPISTVIGSPISGLILNLEGIGGLHGWQWIFLIEAAPAVLMTFAVLYYLTDRPAQASWLEPNERKMAARPSRRRAGHPRIALQHDLGPVDAGPTCHCVRVRLYGAQHPTIWPKLLSTEDRQGFRLVERPGRVRHCSPLPRWRRWNGALGAAF